MGSVVVGHASPRGLVPAPPPDGTGSQATLPTVDAVGRGVVSEAGYPLASHTYLVMPSSPKSAERGAALAHFARWIVGPGQALLRPGPPTSLATGFVALRDDAARGAREAIAAMRFDGRPLLVID
jgi:hypothetical protein